MTIEEAKKIAATCSTADGGCSYCIDSLREFLQNDFPEFLWTMNEDQEIDVDVNEVKA